MNQEICLFLKNKQYAIEDIKKIGFKESDNFHFTKELPNDFVLDKTALVTSSTVGGSFTYLNSKYEIERNTLVHYYN